MANALLLIGAPGAGKSSVLEALATRLEIDGVEHGAIESEQLGWGWPPLGAETVLEQLDLVLGIQRRSGRRLFLIAATPESQGELEALMAAAGSGEHLVVCLCAGAATLADRLEAREPDRWPGKRGLIEHAQELAAVVPALAGVDLELDTEGRSAEAVADDVAETMRGRALM